MTWKPCWKKPVRVEYREQVEGEASVSTREGITPLRTDDLIIRGVQGECYPIGRDIFTATYDLDPPTDSAALKADRDALKLALAASQAEVRELRGHGGHADHCLADAISIGPAGIEDIIARGGDPSIRPQPCTCAIGRAPTSDTALRGLCERVLKLADKHGERSHECIINEVLGPGAEPISAEIKEGRMDTISEGTPMTPAELVQWAVESKDPVMEDIFTYHAPSGDQQERYLLLRAAAKQFAYTIHALCAPGPDRTHAIRQVREATMTANQSIATNNAIYR